MLLELKQIERIAHLARIEINQREAEATLGQLNAILGLIEEMQAVDTDGVEPKSHPQDVSTPLRVDLVSEGDQRSLFQSVAPKVEDGLYLVPKVIE